MNAISLHEAREEAEMLLGLLGERHTFQTFDDSPEKRRTLARVLHGALEQHIETLADLNARGAGIFVMINAGDGVGRKRTNVRSVRALFVDLDGAPLEPIAAAALAPHCIIESSPGRWHAYWLVAGCDLPDFSAMQKSLADLFHGDRTICDLCRVMRVPGFNHLKGAPFRSRILDQRTGPAYSATEFRAAFKIDLAAAPKARDVRANRRIVQGERNAELFNRARGFVRRGVDFEGLRLRLRRINEKLCDPPLCEAELMSIADSAFAYGSDGFVLLSHALLDSPEWRILPPSAHDIVIRAFRRYNGANNGSIALPHSDFSGRPGFSNKAAYYRHRAKVVNTGILIPTKTGKLTANGREADLFSIAPRFLQKRQG